MGFILFVLFILFVIWAIWFIKRLNKENQSEGIINIQDEEEYLPYHAKLYFFSRSEKEFFNILNSQVDAIRYTIFPKVRIGDFIEVDYNDRYNRTWRNKIQSKHIDFLVWDLVEGKIALAIELDGDSHNTTKMMDRDDFVNKLYKKIGLKLVRVRVGTNFTEEIEKIKDALYSQTL